MGDISVSLQGVTDLLSLNNDEFGVQNALAEAAWQERVYFTMSADTFIFKLIPALWDSAESIFGGRLVRVTHCALLQAFEI